MKTYTIAETFVGAGGAHIGFKQKGFKTLYVNDINKDCLDTLLLNNPEIKENAHIDHRNIIDIDTNTFLSNVGLKPNMVDVFFGGIVCKGFSLAGERSPNDERNYFYHKQIELVSKMKPVISIIENVPGILNATVLSPETPIEFKEKVNKVWQELENYKGKKAELRKKDAITEEFLNFGKQLRKQKVEIVKEMKEKKYLSSVMDDICKLYENIGYKVSYQILNAAWYGSGTKRQRVIIVAVRNDVNQDFIFPKPTHFLETLKKHFLEEWKPLIPNLKKALTVGDCLAHIDYNDKSDIDNRPMNHAAKTVKRFKYILEGESIVKTMHLLPKELKISKFYSRGSTMRLHNDKSCPTLVPGHSNFPVHPKQHRSITVREAACITGFPMNYTFIGNHSKRCEHVGNAVPPPLATALAQSCVELLDKFYRKK
ncbi:MAG: DNA cytosine methyltransferase [Chitinophagales bacterium]